MTETLHDCVTEAARSRPDARALIGEDRTFTYAELDDYSNRLAWVLRSHGCERGHRVALLMPNSAHAVATLLGVLKAGCAYVPLDPSGGVVRIADMLRQCEPKVLIANGCAPQLVEDLDTRGVVTGWLGPADPAPRPTDFTLADIAAAPSDLPVSDVGPDDLAYILFTSGTTGSPKGVPVRHRSARAFRDWSVRQFGLGPDDRVSGHTALTFDLSIFDIFTTFGAGAELHLVPKRVRLMPHEVARFIEERELTLWFSVPSQLAYVARFDALADADVGSLRHVAWCGDVLTTPSLLYWKRRLPGVTFTNLYGPTETTVASSYHVVPDSFDDPGATIPIGTACTGEELLVLDEHLVGVPEGAVGDLYIGGIGLSPGYWRDLVRTEEAFIQDPRSADGSERLYRTGDRGRLGPGGAVEFLGRADFQIKTGGYRVEPAEVERAVLALPKVTACVVVAVTVDDFSGNAVGCVYVPSPGTAPRASEMKKQLADALPAYMVPSRWLALAELPLDSRGKVDRARARSLMKTPGAPAESARTPTAAPHPLEELQRT
jgi:amino acid adenylation domain-containing protein